jgi:hypothetical protein
MRAAAFDTQLVRVTFAWVCGTKGGGDLISSRGLCLKGAKVRDFRSLGIS